MTRAAIIQARMRSTRLPAKVLLDLAGKPVLQHVIERCARVPGIDVVVCAIPEGVECEALAKVALSSGARVFAGSEDDVLARYIGAAESVQADIVLRVTSDCPLIDPEVCGRVIDELELTGVDYASNITPRSFPQGLDCEAFRTATLYEAAKSALALDHEHVTPWHRRSDEVMRVNVLSGRPELADLRWTLDFPEDLAFLRAVFEKLQPGSAGNMQDVLNVLEAHPDISLINACRRQDEFVVSWRQSDDDKNRAGRSVKT